MTNIDGKVLEKAIDYNNLLTDMRRYAPTYEEMLQNLPEGFPDQLDSFVRRVRSDVGLTKRLDVPQHKSKAHIIAQHYDELEKYFTGNPQEFVGGGGTAVSVLDHLAYFIRDIQDLGGKVNWIPRQEYGAVREELETRLQPLFEQEYLRLENEAEEIIGRISREKVPEDKTSPTTLTLFPLFIGKIAVPDMPKGSLYLLEATSPSYKIHRVLLDIGKQRQIEFCDLSDDFAPGLEPDKGYMITTLTKMGYLPIPKQRFMLALEKIDMKME